MSDTKKNKLKIGRPEIEFDEKDLKVIETFGEIKASYELMAGHFGCSKATIIRRMEDGESEFCNRYKKGLSATKELLAKKQIEIAMKGNTTMLIWLGKQYLDQSDKQDIKQAHTLEGTFADWLKKSMNGKDGT